MIRLAYCNIENLNLKKAYGLVSKNRQEKIDFYRFEKDKKLSCGAYLLANKMLELSGLKCKPEDYEDMAVGLVSEFTNIISGHAVTVLSEYNLDISPPFCVMGHNHMIAWPKNYPVIAIPFVTSYGPFEVDVCFK